MLQSLFTSSMATHAAGIRASAAVKTSFSIGTNP